MNKVLSLIAGLVIVSHCWGAGTPTGGPRLSPPQPVAIRSDADPTIPLVLNAIGVNQANGWGLQFVDLGGPGLFNFDEYAAWTGSSGQSSNPQEDVEGLSLVGINCAIEFNYASVDSSIWPHLRWFQVVATDQQWVADSSQSPFVQYGSQYYWIDGGQPTHSNDSGNQFPPTLFYDGSEYTGGADSWANAPPDEPRPPLWWNSDDFNISGMRLADSPWTDVSDGASATLSFSTYVAWVTDANGSPLTLLPSALSSGTVTLNIAQYGAGWGCVLQ